MQEVDDKFCRRGRLFFRDPVPAIRDGHIFDVIGDTPDHRADQWAECSFATEGQDRHLKLALRKERLSSAASWLNAKNWAKPARIAPGCA